MSERQHIYEDPPIHYTDILQKMKTCILKADDNFNEKYEGIAQNISHRLTQDIEKADIPDGRGHGQIIQNGTKKIKLALEKWRP